MMKSHPVCNYSMPQNERLDVQILMLELLSALSTWKCPGIVPPAMTATIATVDSEPTATWILVLEKRVTRAHNGLYFLVDENCPEQRRQSVLRLKYSYWTWHGSVDATIAKDLLLRGKYGRLCRQWWRLCAPRWQVESPGERLYGSRVLCYHATRSWC